MKLSADQSALADALRWVALALPTRTPYPALMGIHLDARDGRLKLTAYDDAGYHAETISAEIYEPGQMLIPGALLRDLVSALPSGQQLDLIGDGRTVRLSANGASYRIPLLPIDDYPLLPEPPDVVGVVDPSELSGMLNAVAPAVDDTVEVKRGGVHLAALDGTLSIAGVSPSLVIYRITDWDGDDVHERMSPGLLADALRGFESEPLGFGCSDGLISLEDSRRRAICRTYYPTDTHYARLFRVEPEPHSVIVDAVELTSALRRTALVDPASVRLALVVGSALKVEADDAIEHVEVSEAVGEFRAHLSPDLLTKALRAIDGPVRLSVADNEHGSVIVRPMNATETGAAVIAPKREV